MTLASLCLLLTFPTATAPAEQAVFRFFQAADAGDCETLRNLTLGDHWQDRCPEALAEMREHDTRLLFIESVQPEGRAPQTLLVRLRVHYSGREHLWIVPAVPIEGRWRLAM